MITTDVRVSGLSQDELLAGCIAGRRDHQEILYRYFSPKMFSICLRYGNDYHSAEDILQEGFIKVFHNLDKFRGEGSFEGWMKRIFINTAIEQYRKSNNHNGHAELNTAYGAQQISGKALQNLATEDLMRLVQQLSPGYRAVFNLYVIEGYSHKEIAALLEISEGTSKSQLARARALLQRMLKSFN